jgi:hypothetical protein
MCCFSLHNAKCIVGDQYFDFVLFPSKDDPTSSYSQVSFRSAALIEIPWAIKERSTYAQVRKVNQEHCGISPIRFHSKEGQVLQKYMQPAALSFVFPVLAFFECAPSFWNSKTSELT